MFGPEKNKLTEYNGPFFKLERLINNTHFKPVSSEIELRASDNIRSSIVGNETAKQKL